MGVSLNMLTTHHGPQCEDMPSGKPIHQTTSGLHVQYTHADVRQFYFVSGFSLPR